MFKVRFTWLSFVIYRKPNTGYFLSILKNLFCSFIKMSYILRGEIAVLDMAHHTHLVSIPSVYKTLANSILKTPSPRDNCILYLKANEKATIEFREEIINFFEGIINNKKGPVTRQKYLHVTFLNALPWEYSMDVVVLYDFWRHSAVYMQCSLSVSLSSVPPTNSNISKRRPGTWTLWLQDTPILLVRIFTGKNQTMKENDYNIICRIIVLFFLQLNSKMTLL